METKHVSVLTADIKATKAENGSYDMTLSLPEVDRDNEVIDAKALQWTTPGRMPIDVDHGMSVVTTVGSGVPAYEGDVLKLTDFRFASTPFAQDVKTLVDEEHISKMSVAFMAASREKDEKDGKVHIRTAELLNAAIVAIPSLREADIAFAAKSLAALGHTAARVQTKAVAGSYEERSERLREALVAEHPTARWLWIRATFDDSVVYEVEDGLGEMATYQSDYAPDGDTFTFTNELEVELAEIIVPPAKGMTSSTPDPEALAAAPAAAGLPAPLVDPKALAVLAEAEALLIT